MRIVRSKLVLLLLLVPIIGFGAPLHILTAHLQSAQMAVAGCSYTVDQDDRGEEVQRSSRCDNPHVEAGGPFVPSSSPDSHGNHDVSDDQTVMLRVNASGPCLHIALAPLRDDVQLSVATPVEDRFLLAASRPGHALSFQRGPPLG